MTSLGPLASLADRLPARGRTARAFVLLVLLFAAIAGAAALVGAPAAGVGLFLLRAAMAIVGFLLFSLIVLLQWRRQVDFKNQTLASGEIPRFWRLFLLPYRRADIERMAAAGRLAELMTLSMLLIMAAGLLIAVVLPKAGNAEEIRMAELRVQTRSTKAEVERDSVRQSYPSAFAAFAFDLTIPRGWLWFEQDGRAAKPDGTLQLLGRYGEPAQKALIEVYALQLEREVAPEDWLDVWMAQNHYAVQARRMIPSEAGRNADVLASRLVDGRTYLYRLRTYKNGKFIYLLHCLAEEAHYPAVEDGFLVAAASFRLTNAPQQSYAEPLQALALDKPFHAGFKIPQSWAARADTSVDARSQSWGLSNGPAEARVGLINVYAAPRDAYRDAGEVAERTAAGFRALGGEFADAPLEPVQTDVPGVSFATRDSPATINGHPAALRQTIIGTPKGWAAFTLLTALPDPDLHLVAAIDKRGLDIAVTSFLAGLAPA